MYDMYPDDWGYSQHRAEPTDRAGGARAVQSALDLRDNGGPRPDDN
ncbi:MAG TPA: hypothetical protein VK365_01095 [Nocardioidaceae bacterium]|nr:hypothetical protein [Nocardioidaceae bacterium]